MNEVICDDLMLDDISQPEPPNGQFQQTVWQTVEDLLRYDDQLPPGTSQHFAQELCSMTALWRGVWFPVRTSCSLRGTYKSGPMDDHTLVALAYFGMTAAFESLLPSCGKDRPVSDAFGPAEFWAAYRGHVAIVEILRERGSERRRNEAFNRLEYELNDFEIRGFAVAAYSGNLDLVRLLLPDNKDTYKTCVLAMRTAAQAGHIHILRYIIENIPWHEGYRDWAIDILIAAAYAGREDIADFAISELGAKVNGTIPMTRSYANDRNRVHVWLGHFDFEERPAIYLAASRGHVGMASYLLAKGAKCSGSGWNALTIATRRGYTRTVEVLLEAGAEPDTEDEK